jgi:hypothetical protein
MAFTKSAGNKKMGVGCMVLFALPFFAVGVGMTGWCAWIAWQHSAMQSWVETPAVIKDAQLKVIHGKSTSYQVVADYKYQFGGRSHIGERVSIGGDSDNFYQYQHEIYQELKQHLDRNQPFRCFVNPDRPSEAVLYRDLRGEMMSFFTLFATVFGSAGLGIATAVILGARWAPTVKDDVPADAPWTSRADWEAGLIPAGSSTKVAFTTLTVVAVYALVAMSPLLSKFPEVFAHSDKFAKWASFAFPLIAVLLIAVLAYLMIRARKFGESTLLLASTPGVIGGQLAGVVRVPKSLAPADGFRITLNCLDWVAAGKGRQEVSVWQDEQLVMEPMRGDGEGTAIPVLFAIPFDCQETTRPGQQGYIHWRLDVAARVPGVDYNAKFDVPIFKTAESRPDFKLDEGLVAQVGPAPNHDLVLREAGIIQEPFAGGVRLVFPMARHAASALVFTAVLAGMLIVIWVIHAAAPIMAIIFGLFSLLVVYMVLDLWFYRSVAEASSSGLVLRGGLFGIGRTRVIPVEDIEKFTLDEGMSSGNTMWNNVVAVLRNGKKQTVGRLVSSKLAQRIVIDELQTALGMKTDDNDSSPK